MFIAWQHFWVSPVCGVFVVCGRAALFSSDYCCLCGSVGLVRCSVSAGPKLLSEQPSQVISYKAWKYAQVLSCTPFKTLCTGFCGGSLRKCSDEQRSASYSMAPQFAGQDYAAPYQGPL